MNLEKIGAVDSEAALSRNSSLQRREFLIELAAIGGVAVVPEAASLSSAQVPARNPGGTYQMIDIHHHCGSPGWKAALSAAGVRRFPDWTPSQSLEDMDKAGVGTAITSVSEPIVWNGDEDAARRISRECNEYAARLMADHRGRFGMFTTLPLPYVGSTVREIEYGLDVLKADGVCMMSNYQSKYLGDPAFAPVMDELSRRRTVIYVHPTVTDCSKNLLPDWGGGIELTTDTTRSIASVIFSGTAARCADIRFIWSHAGGSMPYLLNRFMKVAQDKDVAARLPKGLIYELQKFYYDTAQAFNPYTLASFSKLIPTSHIVFGTDFPTISAEVTYQGLKNTGVFTVSDLRAIGRDNAIGLFPRLNA